MIHISAGPPPDGAFAPLFETTGWNEIYACKREELELALRSSWLVVGAYSGGELIGLGRLLSDGVLYALVVDLIVHPYWQRRGIGTRILSDLVEQARRAGIRDMLLFCAHGYESFYRNRGFVARPGGAPGMTRRLVSD